MDFITVYQKDYLWPSRPPIFPRSELTCNIAAPVHDPATEDERKKSCGCCCDGSDDDDGEVEVERSKIMVRKCPKIVKIEYEDDNENQCLAKLLKIPPKSDALKKHNQDRLKSTYQADYDHLVKPPTPTCPTTIRATSSTSPAELVINCRNPIRSHRELMRQRRGGRAPEEVPGVPPCHDRAGRQALRKQRRVNAQPEFMRKVIPSWSSEYRDAIGKVGAEILVEGKLSKRAKYRRKLKMAIRAGGADDGTMRLG